MSEEQEQSYHGNGEHTWERVAPGRRPGMQTMRLRVPHGWLYLEGEALAFVPMPDVVKHKV